MVEIRGTKKKEIKCCEDFCETKLQGIANAGYKIKTVCGGLGLIGILTALSGTRFHSIKEKKYFFPEELAVIHHTFADLKGEKEYLNIDLYTKDPKLTDLIKNYAEDWEKKFGSKAKITISIMD